MASSRNDPELALGQVLYKCMGHRLSFNDHRSQKILKKSPHWSKRALLLQIKDAWNERLFTGKLCYREEEEEGSTLKEFRVQKRMSGTFLENHSEVTASISRSTIKP